MATYFLLTTVSLIGIGEFLAMTTITRPFTQGTGPDDELNDVGSGNNRFFTTHGAREAYRSAAPMLGNVTALCLLAIMLCVGYALMPRRNVDIDIARGPLRRGHGLDVKQDGGIPMTGGKEPQSSASNWPLKDADQPGDMNPVNDHVRANIDTEKDVSAQV